MPKRFERHARSAWEWGPAPARSDEVRRAATADPNPAKRPPGRKDTKRWCRGKVGVEHELVPAVHSYYGRAYECGWRKTGYYALTGPLPAYPKGVPVPRRQRGVKREFVATGREWRCFHEWRCEACGKWLGPVIACPARSPEEQ